MSWLFQPLLPSAAELSAGGGTTINGALGTATASGYTASVDANRTIAASLGTATASGFQATVANSTDTTVNGALGTAAASGFQATVANSTDTTISGALGTASASGFTATVDANRTIAGALGTAAASGFQATVSNTNDTVVNGNLGTVSAVGYQASLDVNRTIAAALGTVQALGFRATIDDGIEVPQPVGGGGYLPSFRRKTRREIHAERVRLGILPEQIKKAAQKVVEKAAERGDPEEVYEDNTAKYQEMFLREIGATKWAPDYARAIAIQLEIMERDAEDALLLM